MKVFIRNSFVFFVELLSLLNKFIPKNNKIILFYTNPKYNDNVRALLQWCVENVSQQDFVLYSCVKIALPYKNKHVFFISRVQGLFVFLRAKYVFYDVGTTRIRPSKEQIVVQLWHGTPLKKIGRSVSPYRKKERLNAFSFVITTSTEFKQVFAEAFECSEEQVLIFEYPRNDYLLQPEYKVLKLYQNQTYKKNILWMPTFRKSYYDGMSNREQCHNFALSFFSGHKDLRILNDYLCDKEYFLTIKLHPASIDNSLLFPDFSNIKIFNNLEYASLNVQNYSFVSCFDVLITDYSSIYFDWILLDRPLAFTVDDIDAYSEERGFVFNNPLEYMPGEIIHSQKEFYNFIEKLSGDVDNYALQRKQVREYAHTTEWNGDACKKIIEYVGLLDLQ